MKGTILYVGNFELPDKSAAANRVVSNGKLFNLLGYRVAFLGINKTISDAGIYALDSSKNMYEQAYPKGNAAWFKHMYSVENIDALAAKFEEVSMIILYNAPFVLLKRAKAYYKKKGIKVVYDCTEWTTVTEGSFIKRIVKGMDEHFIRNRIGHVADGLIVVSKMMEKGYKKCKNLLLLPPLVDLNDAMWHQNMEKDSSCFEFCFAGRLDGNKDSLDVIVEAFSGLKDESCVLRIIGVTEDEFKSVYSNCFSRLTECRDRIIFMGELSHNETIKYVKNSDCYIFIRQSDTRNNAGFPTKFAEAFSLGIPIITTDISDIKHYFKGNGTVVDTVSVCEIQKAMEKERADKKANGGLVKTFHYESFSEACGKWLKNICD